MTKTTKATTQDGAKAWELLQQLIEVQHRRRDMEKQLADWQKEYKEGCAKMGALWTFRGGVEMRWEKNEATIQFLEAELATLGIKP